MVWLFASNGDRRIPRDYLRDETHEILLNFLSGCTSVPLTRPPGNPLSDDYEALLNPESPWFVVMCSKLLSDDRVMHNPEKDVAPYQVPFPTR